MAPKSRRGFWSRHLWPRRREILFHRHVAYSVVGGSVITLLITFLGDNLGVSKLTYSSVSTALLPFAALSFGGCVTGATVAIALPNDRLLMTMAVNGKGHLGTRIIEKRGRLSAKRPDDTNARSSDYSKNFRSLYADLVFTFIYAGVIQLIMALCSVLVLVLVGDQTVASSCSCDWWRKASILLLSTIFIYSVLQLMSSLSALLGIANSRDKYARAQLR